MRRSLPEPLQAVITSTQKAPCSVFAFGVFPFSVFSAHVRPTKKYRCLIQPVCRRNPSGEGADALPNVLDQRQRIPLASCDNSFRSDLYLMSISTMNSFPEQSNT